MIIPQSLTILNNNVINVSVDLKEDHSWQTRSKAQQDVVGDQEEPLYHDEGLIPKEIGQKEDGEQEG